MSRQHIGRYGILREIGRGGMATVHLARDPLMRREVALKILPREFLHDPQFRARFEREAQAVAALEHPAIVPVYDFGEADGQPFLVMRYMTGGTQHQRIAAGPLPLPEIARLLQRLACALDKAHARSIIHRDLKPANVLFDDDEPCLSDFGLVKMTEGSASFTGSVLIGTPAYMSPEQARAAKDLDRRTDVYSLGVILFEMLTGQQPYHADTPMGLAIAHINDPVPRILDVKPDLPAGCEAVIQRALAKNREERYATAGELARAVAGLTPAPLLFTKSANRRGESHPATERLSSLRLFPHSPCKLPFYPRRRHRPARPAQSHHRHASDLRGLGDLKGLAHAPDLRSFTNPGGLAHRSAGPHRPSTLTPPPSTPPPSFSDMVFVPAGEFLMGSSDSDSLAADDEKPQHTVDLDDFWIDRTEVMNAMHERCVNGGACQPPSNTSSYSRSSYYGDSQFDDYPVIYVDWNQAKAYCEWRGARLPTEAEWEKAARGTDGRIYPWGDSSPDSRLLNFNWNVGDTTAVGSYPDGANPYGALDMAGNVWEWVADWYDSSYYANSPLENPSGPSSGEFRVVRGGSWFKYV